ncbi:4'-phosphopantetheinyl transferase family protein [Luteipulveratus halotolerans]|uniref:hypothetical protein n=1 Tax=Luteipulveratus halotolerans TaxID=1631356 RepID=UPI0006811C6A|nr:hypothetical protein [Luteipulveratus halotolerans]
MRVLARSMPTSAVLGLVDGVIAPRDLLTPPELDRHDRLWRRRDHTDFVAARVLARLVLLEATGETATALALRSVQVTQVCDRCGGEHGRPRLPAYDGLGVSWAHAGGVVAAAVGPGDVGVDVERVGPGAPPAVSRSGVRTWHGWTRAEALVKAGVGDLDTLLGDPYDHPLSPGGWRSPYGLVLTDWADEATTTVGAVAAQVAGEVRIG